MGINPRGNNIYCKTIITCVNGPNKGIPRIKKYANEGIEIDLCI